MPTKKLSRKQQQKLCLTLVITMSEAMAMWRKNRKTIEMQIYKGRISARQSPQGAWLISTDSIVELWGKPEIEPGSIWLIKEKS